MVRYLDPEENPEGLEDERRAARKARQTPAERLARMKERNAALTGVEAIESAREVALRQLDTRSRSRAELCTAILNRGFSAQTAEEVLDRLENVGLINDEAYAAMVVRDRFALRGAVGRAVVEELKRKGISSQSIALAMEQISSEDEYDKAKELARRKVRSCAGLPRQKAWNRLSGMLARKGYSPSICARVASETLAEWNSDGSEWEEGSNEW